MIFFKRLPLFGVLIISFFMLNAQGSFTTKFETSAGEGIGLWMQNSSHEYIGFVSKQSKGLDTWYDYLYRLNEFGDTILSKRFAKEDTIISVFYLIQSAHDPIEYLVSGTGYKTSSLPQDYFNYFIKVDENFNRIWEKHYYLKPSGTFSSSEHYQNLIKNPDGSYLFATNSGNAPENKLTLFNLAVNGDSLKYRVFTGDSAGFYLLDVLFNIDSSEYFLLTYRAHNIPLISNGQRITVDLNLNQLEVDYYARWFDDGLMGKLLPDGSLVTGGLYDNMEPPRVTHMAAFKHDTAFNEIASCFIADPDPEIRKDNGRKSMDFYYPNSIFVAGTYDYESAIWVTHPSWIVIGKMDSELNLIKETYIGGDAYYHFKSITATSDGGALITATRYDYLTQDFEHDAYIIKLDSIDLAVGIYDQIQPSTNVSVFPNPAHEYLYVKSELQHADICFYNMMGELLLEYPINSELLQIPLNSLPSGMYIWVIKSNSGNREKGKVIITN
jgi:hypothetical protein